MIIISNFLTFKLTIIMSNKGSSWTAYCGQAKLLCKNHT